jgi:hypothetical protein
MAHGPETPDRHATSRVALLPTLRVHAGMSMQVYAFRRVDGFPSPWHSPASALEILRASRFRVPAGRRTWCGGAAGRATSRIAAGRRASYRTSFRTSVRTNGNAQDSCGGCRAPGAPWSPATICTPSRSRWPDAQVPRARLAAPDAFTTALPDLPPPCAERASFLNGVAPHGRWSARMISRGFRTTGLRVLPGIVVCPEEFWGVPPDRGAIEAMAVPGWGSTQRDVGASGTSEAMMPGRTSGRRLWPRGRRPSGGAPFGPLSSSKVGPRLGAADNGISWTGAGLEPDIRAAGPGRRDRGDLVHV